MPLRFHDGQPRQQRHPRRDPIETIGGGITKAAAESIRTVCIDGGTYEESVTLASRVDMLGGFNSAAPRSAGS